MTMTIPPAPEKTVIDPAAAIRQLRLILILILAVVAIGTVTAITLVATVNSQLARVEQLQTDTNDNLCNQSAYQGGTTCQGGDQNGGSFLP